MPSDTQLQNQIDDLNKEIKKLKDEIRKIKAHVGIKAQNQTLKEPPPASSFKKT